MSTSFEQIPPERAANYLANAENAVRQATEPVINILGKAAVADAEDIVAGKPTLLGPESEAEKLIESDAQAPQLVEEIEQYMQDADLHKHFMDEMEKATKPREWKLSNDNIEIAQEQPNRPPTEDILRSFNQINQMGPNDPNYPLQSLKVGYTHEKDPNGFLTERDLKALEQLDKPSS